MQKTVKQRLQRLLIRCSLCWGRRSHSSAAELWTGVETERLFLWCPRWWLSCVWTSSMAMSSHVPAVSMGNGVEDVCACQLGVLGNLVLLYCTPSCAVYCNRPCLFVCLLVYGMTHSDCGWTCGCAGKTEKSLENTCHTWALLRWCFTIRRGAISSVCTFAFTFYLLVCLRVRLTTASAQCLQRLWALFRCYYYYISVLPSRWWIKMYILLLQHHMYWPLVFEHYEAKSFAVRQSVQSWSLWCHYSTSPLNKAAIRWRNRPGRLSGFGERRFT